jgi:hypothetical protein
LIIVAILLITDYMTLLNIYAIRFTPEWLIKRLWWFLDPPNSNFYQMVTYHVIIHSQEVIYEVEMVFAPDSFFLRYGCLGRGSIISLHWTGGTWHQGALKKGDCELPFRRRYGLAKAAELNHYPGPRHVLELAGQLQLSDEQRGRTQGIFEEMKSQATSLGKQFVEKEQLLDSRFAEGTISDAEVEQLVTEISVIQGKLRAVHLRAHLAQRAVLTQDQIRLYDAHRGYQQPEADDPHAGH